MEEVYNFIRKEIGLSVGDTIVVGVSGGPDSMALLYILNEFKNKMDLNIICAHVNHNKRKESEQEKIDLENYCKKNNITFEYIKVTNWGDDNFHNEARSKRYNYFGNIVKKYGAKYLLTAHHGDDLIETILMRIVRGSTLRGYSGFSKIVKFEDYTILRPLINVTKDEIFEYNKNNNIAFVQDASNQKDVYTRNRFRKYIVPEFKKEDPNVHNKFYKFSTTLLEYNDYIDKQVEKKIANIYVQNTLKIDEFLKEEKVIQMKIIYYILEHIYQDDLMLITDNHAELLHQLITSKRANAYIYLPNNLKAIKSYGTLTFVNEEMTKDEYEIEIINYLNLPNGKNIEVVSSSSDTSNNICRLSSKDVKMPLRVRTRVDGDKISVKGMIGSKKVSDIFIDCKIPMHDRNIWPVVVDSNNTVVWLPGLKKSKFDKSKEEKYDIILKYY